LYTVIVNTFHFNVNRRTTQKYLHVVAKEDPQARTVGGQAVHNDSQL